jgi:hypothetical protein
MLHVGVLVTVIAVLIVQGVPDGTGKTNAAQQDGARAMKQSEDTHRRRHQYCSRIGRHWLDVIRSRVTLTS